MVNDNIKIPFGTKLGEIVHISEVESGLTCGCNCLGCGGALVARKGNETTHHFGHHVFVGCKGGIESALHLFAKRAISTAGYLKVPSHTVKLPNSGSQLYETQPSRVIQFDKIDIEQRLDGKLWQYDLVGYCNDERLLIEVAVNHKTGGLKLEEAIKRRESMLEIRLEPKSIFKLNSIELAATITDALDNKVWLCNADEFEMMSRLILRDYDMKQRRNKALGRFKLQFAHEDNRHSVNKNHSQRQKAHKSALSRLENEFGISFIVPSFPRRRECESQKEYVLKIRFFFDKAPYTDDEAYNLFMLMREYVTDEDLDLAIKNGIQFFD